MDKTYEKIKARRKALGMTQDDLAKKVGYYDKSMVSRIEQGKVDVPLSKIMLFAKALDISADELLGNEECAEGDFSELYNLYLQLNAEGREKVFEYANDLVSLGKYKKHDKSKMVEKNA